jgi:hypothetical protein
MRSSLCSHPDRRRAAGSTFYLGDLCAPPVFLCVDGFVFAALDTEELTMTPDEFRKIALNLPETLEAAHMDHPDFRVRGKIFATLGYPATGWGVVKLTPSQQQRFVRDEPNVFVPVKGVWGQRGATSVRLRAARKKIVRDALVMAWSNTAPKRLVRGYIQR